jgi:putative NADPH-quinone reductase
MSKALIVYGYYDENDRYGEILKTITAELSQNGITEIDVVNTFSFTQQHLSNNKQDFSAATADWYRGLRTPDNEKLIKKGQEQILGANHIIFVYPIWWESLPPYMMTWVSEVFRSVSFRVDGDGKPNPRWGGDRKVMIITTAGFSQEVRRETFEKLLPSQSLNSLKEKGNEEKDKFIALAQAYPLVMALNYAGLQIDEQLHLCGVDKGDEPTVLSAVQKSVTAFVKPAAFIEISKTNVVDDVLAPSPEPLLLSGGPQEQISVALEPEPESKLQTSVLHEKKKLSIHV